MHEERNIGLMDLWPAVMKITAVARQEAMRLVLREADDFLRG